MDPNIKPIKCKMRPIAHNLKDKVKQALAEQEAAGIIRKSFSAWSAPWMIFRAADFFVEKMVKKEHKRTLVPFRVYIFKNWYKNIIFNPFLTLNSSKCSA